MCVGVCVLVRVYARQNNVSATHTRKATSVPAVAYRSGFDSGSDSSTGCGIESVSFFHHPTAKTQAVTFRAKPAANSQPGKQPTRLAVNRPTSLAAWQSGSLAGQALPRSAVRT